MKITHRLLLALLPLVIVGCASYVTPGGAVSIPAITDTDISEAMSRQPAANFPARLAVTRVQARGYVSPTNEGYGTGGYTVLTTRDIETEADFDRLAALPEVLAVAPLTRILLPSEFETAKQLRTAAAQLRADVLFIYTFGTSFRTDTTQVGPLQMVSLGFFPNKKAHVTSTCSGAFIDVRTGFVYGTVERSATKEQRSDLWGTAEAIDSARRAAEREAFVSMLAEIESAWPAMVKAQSQSD